MSALLLRRVDPLAHAHAQAIQRWRHAGHEVGLARVPERSDHLSFCAQGDNGPWQGLIAARDWLHHSLPTLQSLLVLECPLPSIVALFRAVPRPLSLDMEELHYSGLTNIEYVAPARLPTGEVPWLDTTRGRVWLTLLPLRNAVRGPVSADSWLKTLPLRLELILGVSHLSLASRRRLNEGDVLCITQRTQRCLSAGRCLGVFTFTEEGLHMQPTVTEASPENTSEPAVEIDLGALPVCLEFLLATRDIDLAGLSQIIAGQLIPLADDAAQRIEVRANGKRVACGELVQLDGQLGVQLLKVYRDGDDE